MKIETRKSERFHRPHCLYCKDTMEDGQSTKCGGCEALYHTDCLRQELGGTCASPGCSVSLLPAIEQGRQSARGHEWPECFHCKGSIQEGQQSTKCGACDALYHTDCLSRELDRRCATPTCGKGVWEEWSRAQRNSLDLAEEPSRWRESAPGIALVVFLGIFLLTGLSSVVLGSQHWLTLALDPVVGASVISFFALALFNLGCMAWNDWKDWRRRTP